MVWSKKESLLRQSGSRGAFFPASRQRAESSPYGNTSTVDPAGRAVAATFETNSAADGSAALFP